MLKKIAPIGFMFAALNAQADFIGLHAGASLWSPDLSGSFRSEGTASTSFDVEKDLRYSDTRATSFYVAIEHPVPMLPNIRIERTNRSESSSGRTNGSF